MIMNYIKIANLSYNEAMFGNSAKFYNLVTRIQESLGLYQFGYKSKPDFIQ